jgi:predicted PhzF superfamily epimerase YddE/YHI9
LKVPLFQVDAFTDRRFAGNPAAVCVLERWSEAAVLQAAAAENNVSETAFLVRRGDGEYDLRWFTPTTEVDLCGHATLASAFVLWDRLGEVREVLGFHTRVGRLSARRCEDGIALSLPSRPPAPCHPPSRLVEGLGRTPLETWVAEEGPTSGNYLAVYAAEEHVRDVRPDFAALGEVAGHGVIVTAPGREVDFVSRYFAVPFGIPEDPVTGSAHCTLVPYWADRLGRTSLRARQLSSRGGDLVCERRPDGVEVAGRAVLYFEGAAYL